MRKITDHKLSDLNQAIDIVAVDEPGPGGANHVYDISVDVQRGQTGKVIHTIRFQKGAVQEVGINGISDEALLVIDIDRLRRFQEGPFACRQNAIALTHLETALYWLQARTRDRMAREVEGKAQP